MFYLWLYGVEHMRMDHLARNKICCFHYMDYTFWLAAEYFLYALSHRQDRSVGPPWGIDLMDTLPQNHISFPSRKEIIIFVY